MKQLLYYLVFLGVGLVTLSMPTGWTIPLYLGLAVLVFAGLYGLTVLVRNR